LEQSKISHLIIRQARLLQLRRDLSGRHLADTFFPVEKSIQKRPRLEESGANSFVPQMKFKVIEICAFMTGIWNGTESVFIIMVFEILKISFFCFTAEFFHPGFFRSQY